MAKSRQPHPLNRLAGKKVMFHGRFEYGQREVLVPRVKVQQAQIVQDLDASVDYLVLPALAGSKAVQQKVASLNAKGASIHLLDPTTLESLVKASDKELLALIHMGKPGAQLFIDALAGVAEDYPGDGLPWDPALRVKGENFDGLDLSDFAFEWIHCEDCSFAGSNVADVFFAVVANCDFRGAEAADATFDWAQRSRFHRANLKHACFRGGLAHTDFSEALLEGAEFWDRDIQEGRKHGPWAGMKFAHANLRFAEFDGINAVAPDFTGADMSGATFVGCSFAAANFRNSNLSDASLMGCNLAGANLSGARLRGASLAGADLTSARVDGADLAHCNLRGAKLAGVDLSKANNYDSNVSTRTATAGPALAELEMLAQQARRIKVTFRVCGQSNHDGLAGLDTDGLRYGWGLLLPSHSHSARRRHQPNRTFSDAMLELANVLGHLQVRYETVEVQSTKSPKGGKELRELVLAGIAEAFAQPVPPVEELAKATKAWREQLREQTAASREEREKARAKAEKQKAAAKKQVARKIEKAVGQVTDTATFLKALELRIEKPKIQKATSMLKAAGFQLFNDISDQHLLGVVKSQTDPDLVYACRIDREGKYACCTQNLNICGGLRGSICKHLLVLIIGLVQAGELDPVTIDGWVASTHDIKPELDKETMGEIFIRYKGAEAGEVDWRPTETVPEDYYTL